MRPQSPTGIFFVCAECAPTSDESETWLMFGERLKRKKNLFTAHTQANKRVRRREKKKKLEENWVTLVVRQIFYTSSFPATQTGRHCVVNFKVESFSW